MSDTYRILIVDDSAEDREFVRRYLQQDRAVQYIFTEEQNIEAGLRSVGGSVPDCILLDYSLTDGTGLSFLERMHSMGGCENVAVVMLTGTGDEMIAVQAMKTGAQDYLIKGRTSADALRMAVRNALYKARTEQVLQMQRQELERLYQEAQEANQRKDLLVVELQTAKESAEAANMAKDRFLATLSHELRTPLTPVLSTVTAQLSEPGLPTDVRNTFEMIRRNVGLEARLIDDLLDLTRITRGKLSLDLRPLDLHACLKEAVDICIPDLKAKEISVVEDLAEGNATVLGDTARLHQVFWNLLKNAVKFTHRGGQVTLSSWHERNNTIAVSVQDNGVGIPLENLPKIFNAFEQGSPEITRRLGGLGLGLAISKALVDAHGGTLEVNSEGANKGAVFTLRMQMETADLEVPAKAPQIPRGMCGEDRPCRVLLVEDHEDSAQALAKALTRRKYQVSTAATVESGIATYLHGEFDLLICDIGLPDGTGLDVIEALRKRGPVSAVALSGFGMEHDVLRSLKAGFAAHLTKPVDLSRLLTVVNEVLHPAQ